MRLKKEHFESIVYRFLFPRSIFKLVVGMFVIWRAESSFGEEGNVDFGKTNTDDEGGNELTNWPGIEERENDEDRCYIQFDVCNSW